jgi:hypothetical protein
MAQFRVRSRPRLPMLEVVYPSLRMMEDLGIGTSYIQKTAVRYTILESLIIYRLGPGPRWERRY